jgi:hypothetical protein
MNIRTNQYLSQHRANKKLQPEIDDCFYKIRDWVLEEFNKGGNNYKARIYGSYAYGVFERMNSDIDITFHKYQSPMDKEE